MVIGHALRAKRQGPTLILSSGQSAPPAKRNTISARKPPASPARVTIMKTKASVASRKFVALISSLKAVWPVGLPERTCSLRAYKLIKVISATAH